MAKKKKVLTEKEIKARNVKPEVPLDVQQTSKPPTKAEQ